MIDRAEALKRASHFLDLVESDTIEVTAMKYDRKRREQINRYVDRNSRIAIAYSLYASAIGHDQ